ncbi:MAG: transglutaminase-like domain-containing protein [Bacteroidales bacterium]
MQQELEALIRLLEDPDEGIYRNISDRILSFGAPALSFLREAELLCRSDLQRRRLETLAGRLNHQSLKGKLRAWRESGDQDLLEGMLLLTEYRYPSAEHSESIRRIETIRKDAWLEINDHLTALEKIRVLNHVFFELHGFHENIHEALGPQDVFINDTLLKKSGSPVSLGILYSVIAHKLDIPVFGVNLPGHFVLAYLDGPYTHTISPENVLFYINTFNKGVVFTQDQIREFLHKIQAEAHADYFVPSPNHMILQRVLKNLMFILEHEKLHHRLPEVDELRRVLQ